MSIFYSMDKTMTSRQFKYFERDAKLLLKARSMRALPRIDEARKENSIKDIPSTLCKVRRFTLEEKEYLPNRAKQKNGSVLDSLRYGSNQSIELQGQLRPMVRMESQKSLQLPSLSRISEEDMDDVTLKYMQKSKKLANLCLKIRLDNFQILH